MNELIKTLEYGDMDIVVEDGRSLHMIIHQNLANQLTFGEKRGFKKSSTISRSSTNELEKKEVKEMRKKRERTVFNKKSLHRYFDCYDRYFHLLFQTVTVMTII